MKHLNIKIHGFIQGVTFRYSAEQLAEKLNIKGFIQNLDDGTVYAEVEGREEDLEKFLNWCRKGPMSAMVEKVESKYLDDLMGFDDFIIKY